MRLLLLCLAAPLLAAAEQPAETLELQGQVGSRNALLVLHATQREDGGWQLAGEYLLLPTLARRYVEGERSPEIGVTTLREGPTPILFGRPPTGELRGTWRGGSFKGTRYGPGGQERERFEFSDSFPSMEAYSAALRCHAGDGRYGSTLELVAEAGSVKSFAWRSNVKPSGHSCELSGLQQQPFQGGLRLAAGDCRVTLREVGDVVKVAAEGCAAQCGSQAYLEPLLIEGRASCRLLRPETR